MIDALAHLDDPRIENRDALLGRAQDAGITDIVTTGDTTHAPEGLRLWGATGVHPQDAGKPDVQAALTRCERLLTGAQMVAVGEVGLDNRTGMPELALQKEALTQQCDLAHRAKKPVIVHCIGCWGELLTFFEARGGLDHGGVLHGYGASAQMVPRFAQLNFYFSFGGMVARPQSRRAREAAASVAPERLLVESDTPDMPAPGAAHSEPAMLPQVVAALAALRQTTQDIIVQQTVKNARRVYGLSA